MTEFPSNSKSVRSDQPAAPAQTQKVISGDAEVRRRPLGQRFMKTFFGGSFKDFGRHIVMDVVAPGLRDVAAEGLHASIDQTVGGGRRSMNMPTTSVAGGIFGRVMTNYNQQPSSVLGMHRPDPRQAAPSVPQPQYNEDDFEQLFIANRGDAEIVVDTMLDLLQEYGKVSIANVKGILGKSSLWTDNDWGWKDLNGIAPRRHHGGYVIDLPRPVSLKN